MSNARKAAIGALVGPVVPLLAVVLGVDMPTISFIHAMLLGAACAVAAFGK
jgi:hypothetical protein